MIEIHLPLPPEGLHCNARMCWQAKARLTKKTRHETAMVARQLAPERPWKRACVEAEFYMPRRRDQDGLVAWLKATLDGLQDGGIVVNDSGVTLLPPKQTTGKWAGRKLVLRVTEL